MSNDLLLIKRYVSYILTHFFVESLSGHSVVVIENHVNCFTLSFSLALEDTANIFFLSQVLYAMCCLVLQLSFVSAFSFPPKFSLFFVHHELHLFPTFFYVDGLALNCFPP